MRRILAFTVAVFTALLASNALIAVASAFAQSSPTRWATRSPFRTRLRRYWPRPAAKVNHVTIRTQ